MKRIVSVIITIMMLLCLSAPVSYAKEYTHINSEYKVKSEYATREQAAAKFVDAVGIEKFNIDTKVLNKFSDKEKISYANLEKVAAAVDSGLISGYEDDTLKPQANITRLEALTILNRALSNVELAEWYDVKFSDTPKWAEKQVDRLAAAGIVRGYGDGTLGAGDFLTHEQINILCDRVVRYMGPAGDYYDYINSVWLKKTTLEEGASVKSDIDRLNQTVSSRITDIIFSLYRRYYNKGEEFDDTSIERKIISVYSAAANQGYRDKIGIEPIKPLLDKIDATEKTSDLVDVMAELEKNGFSTLIKISLDTDVNGSNKSLPAVAGCYTGMDKALMTGDGADKHIKIYKEYVKELFEISGEENSEQMAEYTAELCKELAEIMNTETIVSDISKQDVVYDAQKIKGIFTNFDIIEYFNKIGFGKAKKYIVYDENLAKHINQIITDDKLDALKAYLKASVLDSSSLYLSTDMFEAYQRYYNKLYGADIDAIPSDYATGIVQELLGWELGSLYIKEYFPETAKKLIEDMTKQIIQEYEKIVRASTRIAPRTRNNIITKLKNIKVYAAYPDNIEDYCKTYIVLNPTEDGGSLMEYRMAYANAYAEECKMVVDGDIIPSKEVWRMYPQTVNAMYDVLSNSITIPAGILQAPYFEASAEYAENLGGIGAVIAHEISHAFDRTGAQFDENGNLSDWWTDADKQAFSKLCEKVVAEYNEAKIDHSYVNGEMTLNENIADIAAMTCIISLIGDDHIKLDKMFKNYAKTWRIKATDEYTKLMLKTDVHSPNKIRVNRVLSNFDEFKRLYGVVEGDGMYIPEEKVISIW